jgi:hypothetical protein
MNEARVGVYADMNLSKSFELGPKMRCGPADFIVGRSVSGCNKPEYKAATHPVAVRWALAMVWNTHVAEQFYGF